MYHLILLLCQLSLGLLIAGRRKLFWALDLSGAGCSFFPSFFPNASVWVVEDWTLGPRIKEILLLLNVDISSAVRSKELWTRLDSRANRRMHLDVKGVGMRRWGLG